MSVQNGQDVSAEVTNAAFMSRTENTDTVGSVGLLKPSGSGALILDAQKTINNVITATGMIDQDATGLDFTGTTHIVDGTVKDALEDLDSALTNHISDTSTHGVTGDIVGTTDAQVITNKDIDGGTASNTSRITLPKAAKTTLDALTRKEGTVVYASDEDKVYYDDGTVLKPVGSGSGGGVNFIDNGDAEAGTTGWATYNTLLSASVFASTDAASVTTAHNIPPAVYNIKVKIVSVSTPCGLTVGGTYYAVSSSPTFLIFTSTVAGPAVDITADATITFSEITPRVPFGTANITWTTSSTNPLIGNNSFLFTKDAANRQYQGVYYDFTIDAAYKAKVLKIEMDYIVNSGTFVAGSSTTDSDMIVYLYDVTNGVLIEPSSFKFLSNSTTISDKFSATFQSASNSTSYRLIFHVASTSTAAYSLKFDNISVSPSQYVYGTPITDWVSYTPTITHNSGAATNYTAQGRWRRVGDSIEVTASMAFNNATVGTWDALYFGLPSGLTIDSSKMTPNGTFTSVGNGSILDDGLTVYAGTVFYYGSFLTKVGLAPSDKARTYIDHPSVTNTVPMTATTSDKYLVTFRVPILGWSSSVQVSDGYDGRVVAAHLHRNGSDQTAGPNGSVVKILLNSTSGTFDDVAGLDVTNNRYIVKTSGRYRVKGRIYLSSPNTLSNYYSCRIYKKGAAVNTATFIKWVASTEGALSDDITLDLVAGDYLELYLQGDGDNSVNQLTVRGATNATYLSITKLSGSPTISASETVACKYTNSAGTTINTSATKLPFANKVFDTHGAWDGDEFVTPIAGIYSVTATAQGVGGYPGGQYIETWLNGSTNDANYNDSVTQGYRSITSLIELKAGDRLSIVFRTGTGSTTLSVSSTFNFVSIFKVK